MPRLDNVGLGASPAQQAIRAERARKARRDYGLPAGDAAAFHQWAAWQRGAGPIRRGLEPLAVVETVLWWGLFTLVPEASECEP